MVLHNLLSFNNNLFSNNFVITNFSYYCNVIFIIDIIRLL